MSSSKALSALSGSIKDLGWLFDCRTAVGIVPDGTVCWMALPELDGPSVFTGLLGGKGSFRFGPVGTRVPTRRAYVPGTNVIESYWRTPTGDAEALDGLVWSPRTGSGRTL